ncbi:hypothetical protein [Megamonas funiformis]|mgnify:FL=1|jgi:hypothetical protein|uniref:hypothetical protein n=1 Tax=Megamonas funiformis TaxID=437897 RepID=UPI0022E324F1|nr:hypothetical protein [Megamonas funiformis]
MSKGIGCLGIIIICGLIGSCFSSGDTPKEQISTSSTVVETSSQVTSTTPEIPEKICTIAGIGDNIETWINSHDEPNRDNGMIKNFQNDKFVVNFADNRALNITFQNNNGKKDTDLINQMLPTDIVKISEEEDTSDNMIKKHKEIYQSELIKTVISGSDGTVTLIDQYDNNTGKYISTIIDCTPKLK